MKINLYCLGQKLSIANFLVYLVLWKKIVFSLISKPILLKFMNLLYESTLFLKLLYFNDMKKKWFWHFYSTNSLIAGFVQTLFFLSFILFHIFSLKSIKNIYLLLVVEFYCLPVEKNSQDFLSTKLKKNFKEILFLLQNHFRNVFYFMLFYVQMSFRAKILIWLS